jgi:uncharacterized membrane protein YoaK (UPF0700 family)
VQTVVATRGGGPVDSARLRDVALVGLTVSTGCVDAITWLGLGKVFSAFMTGNLAFLGFTAGGAPGPSLPRVLAATVAFGGGAAIGARIVRTRRDPAALWPRSVSAALAVGLALQTAFLVMWMVVNADPGSASGDALIVLSALAMGIQTSAIFSLGVRADFTTAATATLAVLMGDLVGWKQPRGERGRLSATLAALVAGALTGATLMTHASSWAPVFPLAVTAAVLAVAAIQLHERGAPTEPRRALNASEGT